MAYLTSQKIKLVVLSRLLTKNRILKNITSSFAPKTHDCSRLLLNLTRSHWQESDILK